MTFRWAKKHGCWQALQNHISYEIYRDAARPPEKEYHVHIGSYMCVVVRSQASGLYFASQQAAEAFCAAYALRHKWNAMPLRGDIDAAYKTNPASYLDGIQFDTPPPGDHLAAMGFTQSKDEYTAEHSGFLFRINTRKKMCPAQRPYQVIILEARGRLAFNSCMDGLFFEAPQAAAWYCVRFCALTPDSHASLVLPHRAMPHETRAQYAARQAGG